MKEEVKKARSGSAHGPNGIPYIVYKKCPKLLRTLWQFFRSNLEERETIREYWKEAGGCSVLKEKNSVIINQFRTRSLLNSEV